MWLLLGIFQLSELKLSKGPIAGFIVGKFGYAAIFLYGSGAAACTCVLALVLYQFVPQPHARMPPANAET